VPGYRSLWLHGDVLCSSGCLGIPNSDYRSDNGCGARDYGCRNLRVHRATSFPECPRTDGISSSSASIVACSRVGRRRRSLGRRNPESHWRDVLQPLGSDCWLREARSTQQGRHSKVDTARSTSQVAKSLRWKDVKELAPAVDWLQPRMPPSATPHASSRNVKDPILRLADFGTVRLAVLDTESAWLPPEPRTTSCGLVE
jgi:hypothetical protein